MLFDVLCSIFLDIGYTKYASSKKKELSGFRRTGILVIFSPTLTQLTVLIGTILVLQSCFFYTKNVTGSGFLSTKFASNRSQSSSASAPVQNLYLLQWFLSPLVYSSSAVKFIFPQTQNNFHLLVLQQIDLRSIDV